MKTIDMVCPNCGASLQVEANKKNLICSYCGSHLVIENEYQHIGFGNSKEKIHKFTKIGKNFHANNSFKQPHKKKHIWLWVLGWIFIFPVPLTILVFRNKKFSKKVKYGIIAFSWIVYIVIGMSTVSKDTSENNISIDSNLENNTPTSSAITTENDTFDNEEPLSTSEIIVTENKNDTDNLADDEIINRFIIEFNNKSLYEITDISKGNIKTKYFGYANNRYLEIINANADNASGFCLNIHGGNEEKSMQEMFDVFKEAAKVFDSTITNEYLEDVVNDIMKNDVLENCSIGDHIVITYVPIKELSYGKTDCRIDMMIDNYK